MKFKLLLPVFYCLCMLSVHAQPQFYTANNSTAVAATPFATGSSGLNKIQWLMLSHYFPYAASGNITAVYFRAPAIAGTNYTLSNLSIAMGQSTLGNFTSAAYVTSLGNVYTATSTPVTVLPGGWIKITLQTPFTYNNTKNFIVEASVQNSTFSSYNRSALSNFNARIYGNTTLGAAGTDANIVDFGFDMSVPPASATTDDLAVIGFTNTPPGVSFCPGTLVMNARINNAGHNPIYNLKISWLIDTIQQQDINYISLVDTFTGMGTNSITQTLGTVDFTTAAAHTIKVYTSIPNGFPDGSTANDTYSVTLAPIAPVEITPSGFTSICPGNLINVPMVPTPGGSNYTWRRNGNIIQFSSAASSYTATAYGTYTLNATLQDCNTTATIIIDSFIMPKPKISPSNPVICNGSAITFHADTAIKNCAYRWELNGSPTGGTTDTFLATIAGSYVVTRTKFTCSATDTSVLTVKPIPAPVIKEVAHVLVTDTAGIVSFQWYVTPDTSSTPISAGASGNFCYPKIKGNYTVKVSNGGCSVTSPPYHIDSAFLNVNAIPLAAPCSIYPNPAANVLHINAPANTTITVTGMDGRIYLHQSLEKDRLDISTIAPGLYIIRISDKNGVLLKMEKFTRISQ